MCEAFRRKYHCRIYCLQKLRNIDINSKIIVLYYQSCVETFETSWFAYWYGSINLYVRKLLDNIVEVYCKIVGVELKYIYSIFSHHVKKGKVIESDRNNVLSTFY